MGGYILVCFNFQLDFPVYTCGCLRPIKVRFYMSGWNRRQESIISSIVFMESLLDHREINEKETTTDCCVYFSTWKRFLCDLLGICYQKISFLLNKRSFRVYCKFSIEAHYLCNMYASLHFCHVESAVCVFHMQCESTLWLRIGF